MDFLYTLDANAEKPIICIDKHIGMDSEDGPGIMGDQFVRELMFLDTLDKKSIEVWINSGGGVVTDGEQIYHAILKSKTPVDTVNVGTAASIAGPIFLAGRNRKMMDYAKLMMHPVSGGDEKSLKAFEQSIRTMLSARSFLSEEQVGKLMAKTSWIFAKECEAMGLSTETESSSELNATGIAPEASYKEYSKIVNKLINKHKPQIMGKVTNRLKLNDAANEDAILDAIDAIENKHKAEIAENKSKFDKFMDEMKETKDKYDEAKAKYDALKAKYDSEQEEKSKVDRLANENKAKELIKNAVDKGKIVNEEAVITDWTEQAIANFDKTKNMIEKLPINQVKQVSAKTVNRELPADSEAPSIDVNNTVGYVARMNAKNHNKALNRFK